MTSKEKQNYYESTHNSAVRQELVRAVAIAQANFSDRPLLAIDCGCGAGSDIKYLRESGLEVHAFDIEHEAVERCETRFESDALVHLSESTFTEYNYPNCHLVVADASLFFCPPEDFSFVWSSIEASIADEGVFVGSFLGSRDTMASDDFDGEAFWPQVTTFSEATLKPHLSAFDVEHWVEHELDGKTAEGVDHHWHIFSVILCKKLSA